MIEKVHRMQQEQERIVQDRDEAVCVTIYFHSQCSVLNIP